MIVGNPPIVIWERSIEGSDINELANRIQAQMRLVPDFQRESIANHVVVRAIVDVGARKVWTAGSGHQYFPHQFETSYRSPVTLTEYDVCWSTIANHPADEAPARLEVPTELLQTKLRLWNYHTRYHSLLGNWIDEAIDAAENNVKRAYMFAVYESDGVGDECWSRIEPDNGTYELIVEPEGAGDEILEVDQWLDQANGTITLSNQRLIRAVFGRGGNHHLIGFWERQGTLRLLADVQTRNCGDYSFVLYSLRRVSFQSDSWDFNDWIP